MLSINPVSVLPTPPSKTDPNNFAVRADDFLGSLPMFVTELNQTVNQLNSITSGLDQTQPIAAYSAATTYNFPTVVAGSDGISYRCVGTGVININPITDAGANWVPISSIGGINRISVVSSDAAATARTLHILANPLTLTLPANPALGTGLAIHNQSGALTCVINPGSGKINGIAESMIVNILYVTIWMMYAGSTYGWIIL